MSKHFQSVIEVQNLKGKTAIVRIGCDVPMKGNKILDDKRLREVLPTLQLLEKRGAHIILIGHLGRPGGAFAPSLSLKPIGYHLGKLLRRPIKVISVNQGYQKITAEANRGIVLLENIRFEVGEDQNNKKFAKHLASLGSIFVNEAFSVSHRASASLVGITRYLPSYAGLALYHELALLKKINIHSRDHKSVAIIGGAKVADKLSIIKQLIKKVDFVLTGGAVANTLFKAKKLEIGVSLFDKSVIKNAHTLLKNNKVLILPKDVVVERGAGKTLHVAVEKILPKDKIIDVGKLTTADYIKRLKSARVVFWSGQLGVTEHKNGLASSLAIAKALHTLSKHLTTVIVGGGDTGNFFNEHNLKVTHISTAGGALLEFLAGKKLPALDALGYYN